MNYSASTHEHPSPLFALRVIEKKYPHILKEIHEMFTPLKYDFEWMYKIKFAVNEVCVVQPDSMFNAREIMIGTIILMYSRVPIDKMKTAELHSGAVKFAGQVLKMKPPNLCRELDRAQLYLRINKEYYNYCDYIRCLVTGSNN